MGRESTQKKLSRVRPPRVQIEYEVHRGDAIEMKELPLVVGVLSDLSGKPDPENPMPKLKDRKYVEIDRDNFDDVLAGIKPRLAFMAENKLTEDDSKMPVELRFNSIDDFHPENVVHQVKPLNELLEARERLLELLAKLDGNDELLDLVSQIINNTEQREALAEQFGANRQDDAANSKDNENKKPTEE